MNVREFFPVALLDHDVDDELRRKVEHRIMSEVDVELQLPRGEFLHTSFNTARDFIGQHLPELRDEILRVGKEFARTLRLQEPALITESWFNVFAYGQQERMHHHMGTGIILSGVYYVAAPETGGSFFFHDPVRERTMHHAYYGQGATDAHEIEVRNRPGQLLMFPAWLLHGVSANHTQQQRVSIAFNLGVAFGR
jgi:uncharacterized protein (TIGR02466 family)